VSWQYMFDSDIQWQIFFLEYCFSLDPAFYRFDVETDS